jgi:predicted nucleic acid-binding protein
VTSPRRVVLDANVLFGAQVRDMILRLALPPFELYQPVWSSAILDELMRNLRTKAHLPPPALERLARQLLTQFPTASVDPDPDWVPQLPNQRKDRHVLATAVTARTKTLVTLNTRHFRGADWFGIEVQTPDVFLCALHDEHPDALLGTLREQVAVLSDPPVTVDDLIARLPAVALPKLAARLRSSE